mmetsp:Transcript_58714/g.155332  ORF Transcript_58714/g.155332 Transcript_58714/m.155332 type:complete len:250 (+) Transcript_58714:148-897(+)
MVTVRKLQRTSPNIRTRSSALSEDSSALVLRNGACTRTLRSTLSNGFRRRYSAPTTPGRRPWVKWPRLPRESGLLMKKCLLAQGASSARFSMRLSGPTTRSSWPPLCPSFAPSTPSVSSAASDQNFSSSIPATECATAAGAWAARLSPSSRWAPCTACPGSSPHPSAATWRSGSCSNPLRATPTCPACSGSSTSTLAARPTRSTAASRSTSWSRASLGTASRSSSSRPTRSSLSDRSSSRRAPPTSRRT